LTESKRYIYKRNGQSAVFNIEKIISAIKKSRKSISFDQNVETDYQIVNNILSELDISYYSKNKVPTVEDIQNIVEDSLIKFDEYKTAKAYILYRFEHKINRDVYTKDGLSRYQKYIDFMDEYSDAINAASGSKYDPNSNVEVKNISTMAGEIFKKDTIMINRLLMYEKITDMYGEELAKEYIRQLESHEIYKHDETSILPYCVAITMYPFLLDGLTKVGGHSSPPKHLQSFLGSFINLVFIIASQFAGAVATPEFIMYMDYFVRKEYGNDYYQTDAYDTIIKDSFQQVVYSMNQPCAARNFQSVFWNVSYFDKNYFESMFGNFYFPDATKPQWESVDYLQRKFMTWFNDERKVKMLTFPVETMALLSDGKDNYLDKEYADLTAKMYADGHSFFTYVSDSADSLSSCCRLKNEITENVFSFSLGAGGVATGSKSVMTINVNRMVQLADQKGVNIDEATRVQVNKIQKYQTAFNEIVKDKFKKRMLPVYDAGFISLDKQYLTIGLNGLVEAAESRGLKVSNNDDYINFVESILKPIYEENKKAKTKDVMFNTEFVPAEGLGVKNATWDREAGLIVPRDVYNSYFYVVEDEDCNIIDKFILHGKQLTQYLDGGSALHMNLDEHLTEPQYRHLLNTAVRVGCNYFTFNIPNTICNECGYISKHMLDSCPSCGSKNVDYATRIIGYLKRVSSFSLKRQEEESRRFYA